ncbi:hypothetical protein ANRL2_00979 [Anaerolineae bacterium]|nr:hypothetical protein ANRL2_00979 [Anaerolineae bacterium]
MIGARVSRIIAVISRDYQNISATQTRIDFRKTPVKSLQRIGISLRVSAVTIQRIKIYQVCENKTFPILSQKFQNRIYACHIVAAVDTRRQTPLRENVLDFSDCHDILSGGFDNIEDRVGSRRPAKIFATFSSHKVSWLPDKRARNHSADGMFTHQHFTRDLA